MYVHARTSFTERLQLLLLRPQPLLRASCFSLLLLLFLPGLSPISASRLASMPAWQMCQDLCLRSHLGRTSTSGCNASCRVVGLLAHQLSEDTGPRIQRIPTASFDVQVSPDLLQSFCTRCIFCRVNQGPALRVLGNSCGTLL